MLIISRLIHSICSDDFTQSFKRLKLSVRVNTVFSGAITSEAIQRLQHVRVEKWIFFLSKEFILCPKGLFIFKFLDFVHRFIDFSEI